MGSIEVRYHARPAKTGAHLEAEGFCTLRGDRRRALLGEAELGVPVNVAAQGDEVGLDLLQRLDEIFLVHFSAA